MSKRNSTLAHCLGESDWFSTGPARFSTAVITLRRSVEYNSGNNRNLVSKSSMYSRTSVVPLYLSIIGISPCSESPEFLCKLLGCWVSEFGVRVGGCRGWCRGRGSDFFWVVLFLLNH